MKALRRLAALTCPLALLASLNLSPWVTWLTFAVLAGATAAVVVSVRDKQEHSETERAVLRLHQ